MEQVQPQLRLKVPDLLRHGTLGYAQFLSCKAEVQVPRRHFKGAQCIQRGQTFNHARGSP